jgi:arylsulfatase A-like enzyme
MKLPRQSVLVLSAFIWFAIVAGLLEAGSLLIKWAVFHRFTWMSVHSIWMAPLANLALLAGPAIAAAVLAAWRPRWMKLSVVAGVLAFGLAVCLLTIGFNGGMAFWSVLLLSVGLALRFALLVERRSEGFGRMLRYSAPRLACLVALLMVVLPGWAIAREKWMVRALVPDRAKPNVLLIILDTVRAASLSLHGNGRPTSPRLDDLARTSTVFDLAIAPAAWTLPSHGSMFTGRWPHELSVGWQTPLNDRFPTLAEVLRDQGYLTAGFVANHYYTTRQSGLERGFIHYEDIAINPKEILRSSLLGQAATGILLHGKYTFQPERSTHRKQADEVGTSFLTWTQKTDHRPWFAFLNFFDAHKPYRRPTGALNTVSDSQRVDAGYEESIRYLDTEVGRVLDGLAQRGELDNTLVIITSDHGEQFGRHGLFGHGNSLYREVIWVPLLIHFPSRVPAGRRVNQPVSLRDLPRTILELLGIPNSVLPGVSLTQTWSGTPGYPDTVLAELLVALNDVKSVTKPPMHSLVTRTHQYIRQSDGTQELFNFLFDPEDRTNLADSASARDMAKHFAATLDRRLAGASN